MSYSNYRCMISSEDDPIDGPAICTYPECWLEDCPHKQARDELDFLYIEYKEVCNEHLTRDALCLKIAILEHKTRHTEGREK